MRKKHPLEILVNKRNQGKRIGITSICSANQFVIEAALKKGLKLNKEVLIEATCNQVNQFGGYTGNRPKDFVDLVKKIAKKLNFPIDKVIFGGDHLGPNVWNSDIADVAMGKSLEMIKLFIEAGFTKIHLDASMHLADDNKKFPLPTEISAERAALMCKTAEDTYKKMKEFNLNILAPVYVIGTEVPIPGGMQKNEEIQITKVEDMEKTIRVSKEMFKKYSIEEAWERVIGIVVQPGVEFGDSQIIEYDKNKTKNLIKALDNHSNLVFEGHSTDYQTSKSLKELVEDRVAILKVGPELTYALREGLFCLNKIEEELYKYDSNVNLSNFIEILDMAMLTNPKNWIKHYHGPEKNLKFSRKYSLSDRARYYYEDDQVKSAINKLFFNINRREIPLTILSQYMPVQYKKIRLGEIKNNAEDLVIDFITQVIDRYEKAVEI